MDHQAFAELLGNYGEFFGAIAVVVTLGYLAGQLKQNTRALRTNSLQTYRSEVAAVSDFQSNHAEVFAKQIRGEELDGAEKIVLGLYSQRLFGMMEAVYLGFQDGSISEEVFDARMKGLKQAMATDYVRRYWPIWSQYDYTDSFIGYVESKILDESRQKAVEMDSS